jgi:hypothetical protein
MLSENCQQEDVKMTLKHNGFVKINAMIVDGIVEVKCHFRTASCLDCRLTCLSEWLTISLSLKNQNMKWVLLLRFHLERDPQLRHKTRHQVGYDRLDDFAQIKDSSAVWTEASRQTRTPPSASPTASADPSQARALWSQTVQNDAELDEAQLEDEDALIQDSDWQKPSKDSLGCKESVQ